MSQNRKGTHDFSGVLAFALRPRPSPDCAVAAYRRPAPEARQAIRTGPSDYKPATPKAAQEPPPRPRAFRVTFDANPDLMRALGNRGFLGPFDVDLLLRIDAPGGR